jgi:hypothetical protein
MNRPPLEKLKELYEQNRYFSSDKNHRDFVMFADDYIEALRERSAKWIPVSERLPDPDVQVLVWHRRDSNAFEFIGLDFTSSYGDPENGCWFHTERGDKITHWMPLPSPPEKE